MKLITGKKGEVHVSSLQHRNIISALAGSGSYIAQLYNELAPSITGTTLSIASGVLVHHGCVMQVDYGTTDTVTLAAGTAGYYRKDRVVARWTQDNSTGVENVEWVVIQGTPATNASQAVLPSYNSGNMQEGALIDDCPVFNISFSGTTPTVSKAINSLPTAANTEQIQSVLNDALKVITASVLSGDQILSRGDNTISFGVTPPSGYSVAGVVGVQTTGTGVSNLRLRAFGISTSGEGYVKIVNEQTSTAELTPTISCRVLLVKSSMLG